MQLVCDAQAQGVGGVALTVNDVGLIGCFTKLAQPVHQTISIGVAGFVPNMQADAMTLLRRADAALYRAKRAGRNRVEADTDDLA